FWRGALEVRVAKHRPVPSDAATGMACIAASGLRDLGPGGRDALPVLSLVRSVQSTQVELVAQLPLSHAVRPACLRRSTSQRDLRRCLTRRSSPRSYALAPRQRHARRVTVRHTVLIVAGLPRNVVAKQIVEALPTFHEELAVPLVEDQRANG